MARCLVVAIFVSTLALDVVSGCGLPPSMCGDKQLKLSGYHSDCDKTIDKDNTVQEPQISFDGVDASKEYTLIMVDPDAPNPANPIQKYWLHWLVTDIKGSDIKDGKIGGGVMVYNGPSPPIGEHRYQLLLLKQTRKIKTNTIPTERGKFKLEKFLTDNNLCHLVAGFQYRVKANV